MENPALLFLMLDALVLCLAWFGGQWFFARVGISPKGFWNRSQIHEEILELRIQQTYADAEREFLLFRHQWFADRRNVARAAREARDVLRDEEVEIDTDTAEQLGARAAELERYVSRIDAEVAELDDWVAGRHREAEPPPQPLSPVAERGTDGSGGA